MGTIGSLSARILADASGIRSGLGLTRDELRVTRAAFMDSRTDVEKYGAALDQLNQARDKGAFADPADYARALAALKDQLDPVTIANNQLAEAVDGVKSRLQEQLDTIGKSAEEIELLQLQQQGANQQALAEVQALQAAVAAKRTAVSITASLRTEMDEYSDAVDAAQQALAAGAISQQQFDAYTTQLAGNLPAARKRLEEWNAAVDKAAEIRKGQQSPLAAGREQLSDIANLRQRNLLSSGEALQARVRSIGGTLGEYDIPVISNLGRAFATTHPQVLAVNAAMSVAKGVAGGLAAAYAALSYQVWQSFDAMENVFTQAHKVGIAAEQYFVLNRAAEKAQVPTDALAEAMVELQKRLADAGHAMKDADPTRQFLAGLEAIRQWPSPAERAAAAMQTFGDKGKDLLPIIHMSRAEFAAWKRDIEATKPPGAETWGDIATANDAMRDLRYAWSDLGIIIAGKIAPVISEVANRLKLWLADTENVNHLTAAMENLVGVGELIVGVFDAAAAVSEGFARGQQAVAFATHGVLTAVFKLAEGLAWLRGDTASAASWASQAKAEMLAMGEAADVVAGRVKRTADTAVAASDAVSAAVARSAAPATADPAVAVDAVAKVTAALREQIDTMGVAADAVERWKLQQQGATQEQLQAVAAMQRQRDAAQAMTGLRDDTNNLVDSLEQQIDAVGRSEAELTRLQLAARGLRPEWLRIIEAMQQRLAGAQQAEQVRTEVDQLTKSLREQIATAGMSAEEAARWKLAQKGASAEQLAQVDAMQRQAAAVQARQDAVAAAADRQKTLRDALVETTKRLREQAQTAGMSAEQIELHRLRQLGATPAQLAQVAALQRHAAAQADANAEQRDAIAATNGLAAAVEGSSEALDRIEAYRAMAAGRAAVAATPRPAVPVTITPPVLPVAPAVPPVAPVAPAVPPVAPVAPAVPPIPAEITDAWAAIPLPPIAPDIVAGITPPPVRPIPPVAPAVPPIPAEITDAWAEIPLPPIAPDIVAGITPSPAAGTRDRERTADTHSRSTADASRQSAEWLAKAVELLTRIAQASEQDRITVEQA